MRRIRAAGDWRRTSIGGWGLEIVMRGGGGGKKELLFTGLLYSCKTPGGPCDKFHDFERNGI